MNHNANRRKLTRDEIGTKTEALLTMPRQLENGARLYHFFESRFQPAIGCKLIGLYVLMKAPASKYETGDIYITDGCQTLSRWYNKELMHTSWWSLDKVAFNKSLKHKARIVDICRRHDVRICGNYMELYCYAQLETRDELQETCARLRLAIADIETYLFNNSGKDKRIHSEKMCMRF